MMKKSTREKYNIQRLEDSVVQKRFVEMIQENIQINQPKKETQTIDSLWCNLKEAVTNSAREHLGVEKKKKQKNWFNNVCKEAVDIRNELRKKVLQNPSTSESDRYETQRKITNKIIRREKRLYEKKMIEDMETNRFNPKVFFNLCGNIKKGYKPLTKILTNKSGNLITEERQIVKSGLRQGDALSPTLFNLALEKIVRDTNEQRNMDIIGESVILAHSDDIVVLGKTKEEIIQTTEKLVKTNLTLATADSTRIAIAISFGVNVLLATMALGKVFPIMRFFNFNFGVAKCLVDDLQSKPFSPVIDSKDLQKTLKSTCVVMKIGGGVVGEISFVCSVVSMVSRVTTFSVLRNDLAWRIYRC
ncbi:hypothetical protein QTP88_004090 [Uroleucon formosanum]